VVGEDQIGAGSLETQQGFEGHGPVHRSSRARPPLAPSRIRHSRSKRRSAARLLGAGDR
jgi:hypothetical protein